MGAQTTYSGPRNLFYSWYSVVYPDVKNHAKKPYNVVGHNNYLPHKRAYIMQNTISLCLHLNVLHADLMKKSLDESLEVNEECGEERKD